MFDVLPRSLFNRRNGGIQLSYRYDTALSPTICNGVQNHLAPKTLHSYFTLFKLLHASSIHTRSRSPQVTDHVSKLAQEDFVSEQISQAVMHMCVHVEPYNSTLARVSDSCQYFPILDCLSYSYASRTSCLSLGLGLVVKIFQCWIACHTLAQEGLPGSR